MEAKRLMKVTYQDLKKGIRLNAYADAVIWSEDPSPTLAGLRFGGYADVSHDKVCQRKPAPLYTKARIRGRASQNAGLRRTERRDSMSLTTADEILDLWARNETPEAKVERRAIEALKKDIQTAQDSIQDAVSRYRKAKLRTCSKAKANSEDIFRPLEEYDSQVDIQNAYGYEMITETEYDRLMELWELRAQSVQKAGPYKDRVVEMLELAARAIWDAYGENVAAYDEKVSRMHREARRIAQENLLRDLDSKNI